MRGLSKRVPAIFFLLALVSCGGGGVDSNSIEVNNSPTATNPNSSITATIPGKIVKQFAFPSGVTWVGDITYNKANNTAIFYAGNSSALDKLIKIDSNGLIISTATNSIPWINHGSEIVYDGSSLWATSYGWSNGAPQSSIYQVNPDTASIISQFPCPATNTGFCEGITWDGSSLWSTSTDNNNLVSYSTEGIVKSTVIDFFSTVGTGTHLAYKSFPGSPGIIIFHDSITVRYPDLGISSDITTRISPHSSGWDGQNIWRANNTTQQIEVVYVGI